MSLNIEKLENAFNGPLLDNETTTDDETSVDDEPASEVEVQTSEEDISNQNYEEDLQSNQLKTSIEE